eukprot:763637-Hanusia_phi.AAC.1
MGGRGQAQEETGVEAEGLAAMDSNGFSDPYCLLSLVPTAREEGEASTLCCEETERRSRGRGGLAVARALKVRQAQAACLMR